MEITKIVNDRMALLGKDQAWLVGAVKGKVVKQTVYDFTNGKSRINSEFLGHILEVLGLEICPNKEYEELRLFIIQEREREIAENSKELEKKRSAEDLAYLQNEREKLERLESGKVIPFDGVGNPCSPSQVEDEKAHQRKKVERLTELWAMGASLHGFHPDMIRRWRGETFEAFMPDI